MVHSTNFVQEVEQLDKQKMETNDKETRKSVEQKLKMKTLESGVAVSKVVNQTSNFPVDVVIYMLYWYVVSIHPCSAHD